ncbi:glutathione hydrolase-like YwrD proenzyme isoform X2 [Candoia aspera]|uniref:glutathione hydrolase-like YwrD proenzyme isoform X2 n=1 Tax=Candoia aspera TaxID=51853 RepID=UPI002FD7F540
MIPASRKMSQLKFCSRRSPVVCCNGCVASSQSLATNIGLDILKMGGNAADAAVAVAAALNVTEPFSTGLGGDCFCLYYDASTKQVWGLNGSGRSPQSLTLELLKEHGFDAANPLPLRHACNITVPGAAAGWCDAVTLYGSKKLSMGQILQPAIEMADKGFPVSEITSYQWKQDAHVLQSPVNQHGKDLLINGEAPEHGQVFQNPLLANTFKELAKSGKRGFYEGHVAKAIVDVIQSNGGVMDLGDLKNHVTEEVEPIVTNYKGMNIWEIPPNGQGITTLLALNILENFSLKDLDHNSTQYLHILIEAFKLSFADSFWFCADPEKGTVPTAQLLSKSYARNRSKLIDLQRGASFSLQPDHPNCLAPRKRPYHTIIPALATAADSGELLCCFGVMGGFMQPQGQVQVLLNMLEFGKNPQEALDASRFYMEYSKKNAWQVFLEDGIPQNVTDDLKAMGHNVMEPVLGYARSMFGRGQIITKGEWWRQKALSSSYSVLWAGSDPRADGCALGY